MQDGDLPTFAFRIREKRPPEMQRVKQIHAHVSAPPLPAAMQHQSQKMLYVAPPDEMLEDGVFEAVLTREALEFVTRIALEFQGEIENLHRQRSARRSDIEQHGKLPTFQSATKAVRDDASWKIDPVPACLKDRRVDIGDVSPADRSFLLRALNSGAQGVQVDFDDGHCPTWGNTIAGHYNITQAVRGSLTIPSAQLELIPNPALLIVRPRAWNMDETNVLVQGKVVSGALFDFAVHLFHNGKIMFQKGNGPFLYLPKLETHEEAALWRKIFVYTENQLQIPQGSIKATVLIESIFAAFEMDEILYELRHHSLGLNCGMWDYTASIVVNFRQLPQCLLPDRQQCVSMKSPFLKHYMELLIRTCKRRNAPATTGMVPFVLSQLPPTLSKEAAIGRAKDGKRFEALAGSDGALVYDLELVAPVQQVLAAVFSDKERPPPALRPLVDIDESFYEKALLALPNGFVNIQSVQANVKVALSYVLSWVRGQGTTVVSGCVEDSATAEISRAQLWQWIHHQVPITNQTEPTHHHHVTAALVSDLLMDVARDEMRMQNYPRKNILVAMNLVFRLVTMRSPPAFLTTFLLEQDALTRTLM